jgi:hypothetical protein
MPRAPSVQTVKVIVVAGALLGGAAWLQGVREKRYPPPPATEESIYLTSGRMVRYLTAGYQALAADVYWIRAIQYYGSNKLKANQDPAPSSNQYALLYPLLDLTTTLDPRFNIAYRFGAIFLAEAPPGGAGRPDLAIALLEKGLRERPDKWEYMQDIGFVHYWWTQDFKAAAYWFQKAGDVPEAPWFLRSLAATTLTEGGDRRSSRLMWESIRQSAEIDWLRNEADRRLMQLDALDEIDRLQKIVDEVADRDGRSPDWTWVVRATGWRAVPVDPTGAAYEIDALGRVGVSRVSSLFPLPVEPRRLIALPAR